MRSPIPRKSGLPSTTDSHSRPGGRLHRHSSGFTLVELLVALAVFSIILTAIMALFVSNTRLARSQLHLSDMQQ